MVSSFRIEFDKILKYFLFLPFCIVIASCGGGSNAPSNGNFPPPSDDQALTISGLIGETVSGVGEVTVLVGTEEYSASLVNDRFTVEVSGGADDSLVVIKSTHQETLIGKTIVLKSYTGSLKDLRAIANSGSVTEADIPALYLSAASTVVSVFLEQFSRGEIFSEEDLLNASQTLPQKLIVESAIAIKSILAGDLWEQFSDEYPSTYSLLQEYPLAINIAEILKTSDPDSYQSYMAAVVGDSNQFLAQNYSPKQELLFINTSQRTIAFSAFVVQLPDSGLDTGYFADRFTYKAVDNSIPIHIEESRITLSVENLMSHRYFDDGREICVAGGVSNYTATPLSMRLTKYLETPVFSAYTQEIEYSCGNQDGTFIDQPTFVQLNKHNYGSFESLTSGSFAIGTYLKRDPEIYSHTFHWDSAVVTPNTSGSITQRFDFNSEYSDDGVLSLSTSGRLSLNMNRGDHVEYIALGAEESAIKVLGLLKREDGSIASANVDYLVPITPDLKISVPVTLLSKDSPFAIYDVISEYHVDGVGFELLDDNSGYQLWRSEGIYEQSEKFHWSEKPDYLDIRYFLQLDDIDNLYTNRCEEGDSNCVEFGFLEIEPLARVNGEYFVRVYREYDVSNLSRDPYAEPNIYAYGAIERFRLKP